MQVLLLWLSVRCYKPSLKVDDPSHSVLYLSTGTLSQNEVDILLKWGEVELKKTQNLEKKNMHREFLWVNTWLLCSWASMAFRNEVSPIYWTHFRAVRNSPALIKTQIVSIT